METFLIPIDYTDKSLKALEVAFSLASRIEAQLLLCHVFQPPVITGDENEPEFALPAYETKKHAVQQLRKYVNMVKSNAPTAVPLKFTTKAGDVVEELLDLVRARNVSMVVMGTGGSNSYMARVFGTTSEELVRHAPCPVLVVPKSAELGAISHIVYASALRPSDTEAVFVMAKLKKLFHASLSLLYVERKGQESRINVAVLKNYLLHNFDEDEVAYTMIEGKSVVDGIEHYVKTRDCDLVAFTVSDHALWKDLFHSSVTSRLLHTLNIPMLALPKHGKATALAHMQEKAGQQMDSVHPARRYKKGKQSPVKLQN
ncbi:hypothetical protein GCM10023188_30510 [Pontibacter saemangeumensis]|uniref:UspA domain-containing protein n=1 Tax=Pontibacter saemangeumensis TaxID=1084525 RepID=A0ABP8LVV7_9BACT